MDIHIQIYVKREQESKQNINTGYILEVGVIAIFYFLLFGYIFF